LHECGEPLAVDAVRDEPVILAVWGDVEVSTDRSFRVEQKRVQDLSGADVEVAW